MRNHDGTSNHRHHGLCETLFKKDDDSFFLKDVPMRNHIPYVHMFYPFPHVRSKIRCLTSHGDAMNTVRGIAAATAASPTARSVAIGATVKGLDGF